MKAVADMPLAMANPRQRLMVTGIEAAGALSARLAGLGLIPGVEIEVLQQHRGGYSILRVADTRVSIGRGMVHRIRVCDAAPALQIA